MKLRLLYAHHNRIQCSRYSDLDELIIRKAAEYRLPLIGGTAMELWAAEFKVPPHRKRSDNDLDFLSTSLGQHAEFELWVKDNIPTDKVTVDIFLTPVPANVVSRHRVRLGGAYVMDIPFLIASKLKRFSEKDRTDILWLSEHTTPEELEEALPDLVTSERQIENFNTLFDEPS